MDSDLEEFSGHVCFHYVINVFQVSVKDPRSVPEQFLCAVSASLSVAGQTAHIWSLQTERTYWFDEEMRCDDK